VIFSGIGVLLVIVGGIVFWIHRRTAAKQAASMSWPTCEGRVARSWVESGRDKEGRYSYSARVQYAYIVNGQNQQCERVAWGGRSSSSNQDDADAEVARYPAGSAIRVHYNPEKPGEAVLEPAAKGGLRTLLFVAIIFVVIGAIFVFLGIAVPD
jgi:hypothetical protein